MVNLEDMQNYADTMLMSIIRKVIRVRGEFPAAFIRVHNAPQEPKGWVADSFQNDQKGSGLYDTADIAQMIADVKDCANQPDVVAVIYALPYHDAMREDGTHTGPFVLLGIHMKSWSDKEKPSDHRIVYFSVSPLDESKESHQILVKDIYDEYLAAFIFKQKMAGIQYASHEDMVEAFMEDSWVDLKPEFVDVIVNGMWNGEDAKGIPIANPFTAEFDWSPLSKGSDNE